MHSKKIIIFALISLVQFGLSQLTLKPVNKLDVAFEKFPKPKTLASVQTSSTTNAPLTVEDILNSVGLNMSHLFKISDWKNMCTIRLRERSSFRGFFKAIEKSDSCQATLNDAIVETRIVLNGGQWQCSWSSSSYVAGTNFSFYQMIESKYNDALNLVINGDQYSIDLITNLKSEHLLSISTNKNTAKMSASCRTIPTKSGFNCDLTLQAKLKYLH